MRKLDFKFIIFIFLAWRVSIFLISLFAIKFVPVFSHNYFGGGYSTYLTNPLFWGHLNFDGEHYLSITQSGYHPLEYFFFPLFPYLINIITFVKTPINFAWTGIIISNISFLIALIGIFKLVKLDYKESVAKLTVILLLFFPTSFYFGAYYTESIFLALVVWTFYATRQHKLFLASTTAALASATRIVGIIMFPPIGAIAYMYFLWKKTGDPLIFLHQVSVFGEQRSSHLILLPQVFYRYIFKILPFVNYHYFPNVFTTYLEFACGILILILTIYSFFKLRISYSIYAFLSYLIPTMAGSFSSLPRYTLVLFPIFILSAIYLNKMPKIYTYMIFSVMLLLLIVSETLFWRGYWIS